MGTLCSFAGWVSLSVSYECFLSEAVGAGL